MTSIHAPKPGIKMVFRPNKTYSEERFYSKEFPPFSVAYDGFVAGPPGFLSPLDGKLYGAGERGLTHCCKSNRPLANWPKANIDHHAGVVRLATNSAAAQAFIAKKLGLIRGAFNVRGRATMTLYGNDIDQDGLFTTFVFLNHDTGRLDTEMFRGLLSLQNHLDMTAGLYPVRKRGHLLRKLIWINQPYTDARRAGLLKKMKGHEMHELAEAGHERIIAAVEGHAEEVEPDTRFEVLEQHDGWTVLREIGMHARYAMQDIDAFVSVTDNGDGTWQYFVGRRSNFFWRFPIQLMTPALNRAEKQHGWGDGSVKWGGSDNFVCSPRKVGSKLSPDVVTNEILKPIIDAAMRM